MDGKARVSIYLELKNRLKTGLDQAKQHLNKNVAEYKQKLSDLKQSHIKTFSAMQERIPAFGSAMSLLGNPYVLVTAGLVALTAVFSKASTMANEFQQKMAKANVTAQESPQQLKQTGSQLLALASTSTTQGAVQAAPDAYNVLLSSGMKKETAMDTVKPTLDAAKAGFTDIETVARAAAATMNSSGITDATRVYDILFATLNKGNAEFKDIAQYLPKIIPSALAAGSSLEQVSGAFAFLTAQGQTSEKSTTLLENFFKTVADVDKAKAFKAIGVEIYDANGKLNDLVGISSQLKMALNGLTDKQRNTVMSSLGLDQESSNAFIALAQDANKLKESIDATTNSTGQLAEATKNAKAPMDSWVQVSNYIEVLWVRLGEWVNSFLSPLGEWVMSTFTSIQEGTSFLSPLIEGIGTIFNGIWSILSAIGSTIWSIIEPIVTWLRNSQILKDVFSIIGTIGSFIGQLFEGIGFIIGKIGDAITWVFNNTIKPIIDAVEWLWNAGKSLLGLNSDDSKVVEQQQKIAALAPVKQTAAPTPQNLLATPNKGVQNVLSKADKKEKGANSTGASGSSSTKVITINEVNMLKGDFVSNSQDFSKMGKAEFERFMMELFMRFSASMAKSYN